jgi:hypothetical protein
MLIERHVTYLYTSFLIVPGSGIPYEMMDRETPHVEDKFFDVSKTSRTATGLIPPAHCILAVNFRKRRALYR